MATRVDPGDHHFVGRPIYILTLPRGAYLCQNAKCYSPARQEWPTREGKAIMPHDLVNRPV